MVFHENDSTHAGKGNKEEMNIVSYSRQKAGIHEGRLLWKEKSQNQKQASSPCLYFYMKGKCIINKMQMQHK